MLSRVYYKIPARMFVIGGFSADDAATFCLQVE